jgi:DNA-binding HxlR family transcriptional regulator
VARSYSQYCPVAHALDVVGERWSLLVVRELVHGPLRYTDLLGRLEGCGTNVLAARLRQLEAGGVVRKRKLPPPAASTVYELTEAGVGLRPVLHALCAWGLRTLGPPPPGAELVPGWLESALRTLAVHVDPAIRVTVHSEGETASIAGRDAVPGALEDAQAVITADSRALYHLFVDDDLDAVTIEGDRDAVRALVAAFSPVPAPEGALV